MEQHNRVQWVYASTNNQELEERYAQRLPDLEQEVEAFGVKVEEHLRKMGVM